MSATAAQQIDAILQQFPPKQAAALRAIRASIQRLVPAAIERISYAMPTFEISGLILVHFMGFKDHNSLFPGSETAERLKSTLGEQVTSRGTIQFSADLPIQTALLKDVLRTRIAVINESYPKKNGEYLSFYDNGYLKSKGKYRDGKMHGTWEFYRRDGSLMRAGRLEADKPIGEWKTYPRVSASAGS